MLRDRDVCESYRTYIWNCLQTIKINCVMHHQTEREEKILFGLYCFFVCFSNRFPCPICNWLDKQIAPPRTHAIGWANIVMLDKAMFWWVTVLQFSWKSTYKWFTYSCHYTLICNMRIFKHQLNYTFQPSKKWT